MTNKLAIDPHLTQAHPNHWEIADSYPGMAHFAGTGPKGRRCRDCAFWAGGENTKASRPRVKAAPCAKFRHLTRAAGKPVPARAWSCKYFQEAE